MAPLFTAHDTKAGRHRGRINVQDCWTILQICASCAEPREEAVMDTLHHWSSEREQQRAQASREELVAHLAQATHADGISEPLDGVRLHRASTPTELGHGVSAPSFCVIAQGSKEVLLGDKRYWYDSARYLIA